MNPPEEHGIHKEVEGSLLNSLLKRDLFRGIDFTYDEKVTSENQINFKLVAK